MNPLGSSFAVFKQILNEYNKISKEVAFISVRPSSVTNLGFIFLLNSSSLEKSKNNLFIISGIFKSFPNKLLTKDEYFEYSLLSTT